MLKRSQDLGERLAFMVAYLKDAYIFRSRISREKSTKRTALRARSIQNFKVERRSGVSVNRTTVSAATATHRLTSLHLRPISPSIRELRLEARQYGELNLSHSNSMQTAPDTRSAAPPAAHPIAIRCP